VSSELGDVRTEDSFDIDAVHEWLIRNTQTPLDKPRVQQFRAGASNLTYLLTYNDRELILRRPPVGTKAASSHDMKREYLIQKTLRPDFSLVPQVIALCEDQTVIGSNFYLMQRVKGVIFRRDLPKGLSLNPADITLIGNLVIDGLVLLHHVNSQSLSALNKGPG